MTDHRPRRRSAILAIGLAPLLLPMPTHAQQAAGVPPPVTAAPTASTTTSRGRPQDVEVSGTALAGPAGETTPAFDPNARRAAPAAPAGHALSPWSMFLNADLLVKAVMCGLALASATTWTILLAKTIELGLARRHLVRALGRVAEAGSLAQAERALRGGTVLDHLVETVANEVRISRGSPDGIRERAVSRCSEVVKAEGRIARRGMGALATIGAISPFVGLFGTVWGIMNSFIGISRAQTTNLAVVAPGIAEALLATAIGLAAAIPAVIIYNHFARATRAYGDLVQRASGTTLRLLSRDLDGGGVGLHALSARAAE